MAKKYIITINVERTVDSHFYLIMHGVNALQLSCPHKSVPAIPSLNSSNDILPS